MRCPLSGMRLKYNEALWASKLKRNADLDSQVGQSPWAVPWNAVHVWEHEFKGSGGGPAIHVCAARRN